MDEKIKRIRELMLEQDAILDKANKMAAQKDFDPEAVAAEMEKASELQKQIEVLQKLVDAEKAHVPAPDEILNALKEKLVNKLG